MNKPPRKRNKATSAASSDSTLPDDQDLRPLAKVLFARGGKRVKVKG